MLQVLCNKYTVFCTSGNMSTCILTMNLIKTRIHPHIKINTTFLYRIPIHRKKTFLLCADFYNYLFFIMESVAIRAFGVANTTIKLYLFVDIIVKLAALDRSIQIILVQWGSWKVLLSVHSLYLHYLSIYSSPHKQLNECFSGNQL